MSDLGDIAQELEERRIVEALARFQQERAAEIPSENCSMCKSEIPAARREALPTTHHCVDCAEYLEQSKRQRGVR